VISSQPLSVGTTDQSNVHANGSLGASNSAGREIGVGLDTAPKQLAATIVPLGFGTRKVVQVKSLPLMQKRYAVAPISRLPAIRLAVSTLMEASLCGSRVAG
jgi:hypothetical protein